MNNISKILKCIDIKSQCHNMNHNLKSCKRSPYLPKIRTKVGEKPYVG